MIKINVLQKYLSVATDNNIRLDDVNNIHEKQFINKINNIPIVCYKVEYEYTTVRNNKKNGIKYFLFNSFSPEINMENQLEEYISKFNEDHPNRKLLNVKFLNSECLGYMTL